jgi:hypothetical protein
VGYEGYEQTTRKYYLRNRAVIDEAKARPCMDCKIQYPACVMDLDHRDPSTKLFSMNSIATRSVAVIRAEIAKCDVVCSNCHRIRTWSNK